MSGVMGGAEKALSMLRALPRVTLGNIRNSGAPKRVRWEEKIEQLLKIHRRLEYFAFGVDSPGRSDDAEGEIFQSPSKRGRGQHGGDKHGAGNKGSGQRQNYMRPGYETGNNPFYLRPPREPYYLRQHLRKQYPPVSLLKLQKMIDTNRIDTSKPIDLATFYNTGLFGGEQDPRWYGFNLTDEGADNFNAKINIEVQWASEGTIAAIERCGGVITTAYYDIESLWVLKNPTKFFKKGEPLPRRSMPSQDVILFYTSPENRGYLADPAEVAYQRLALAQKYGYDLPQLTPEDPMYDTLVERKDPRQILYGLHPGWIVNLVEKEILKPKDQYLQDYYSS